MHEDVFSNPGESWAGSGDVARTAATPSIDPPPQPATARDGSPRRADRQGEGSSLTLRLLWIFSLLTAVLVAPSVIGRIEYSRISARERARLDVARANLKDFKLDQISAAYRMLAQSVGPSVVNVSAQRNRGEGQGSGVIVDPAGYIVTNNHVVAGVPSVGIQLSDGRSGTASVVGVDALTDIAVLKTELGDLTAAQWGDSDELEVGDIVWAVGSPFGLQKSVTFGILSAKERRGITDRVIQEFLQTDAAVNPGNSGGPLVNFEGKIIGINTAIIGPSYQGISFAVPSELARASYEQIREHGYVLRGFLGVTPEVVSTDMARALELDRNEGVWVVAVDPNTPASDAGLVRNDIILSWNGEKFSDPTLLSRAIAATPIGSDVKVEVVRNSASGPKRKDVTVKVAARPQQ